MAGGTARPATAHDLTPPGRLMRVMTNVSRPLIALLLAAVAFFAVWTIALKPKSSSGAGGSSSGAGAYQSAIDKAHQAVSTANKASAAHGGTIATSTPRPATTTTPAHHGPAGAARLGASAPAATSPQTHSKTATTAQRSHPRTATAAAAARHRFDLVVNALRAHKTLALLFYNPAASDDRAVRSELATISQNARKVVKVAVPLSELASYQAIADEATVNSTPTLVLIDRARQATTIVGYASTFEIAHRIDDALATK
jgi:hypothetical protein